MTTKVGRSLDEIDSKVKQLTSSIKESSKKTKELDRTLKLTRAILVSPPSRCGRYQRR